MNKSTLSTLFWDRLGIGISTICAIHCLLVPVIISLLPLWPVAETIHQWIHPVFIVFILPTIWFAVRGSHYDRKIILLLSAGFLLVLTGWPAGHWSGDHRVETLLTVAGSLLLIAGHLLNYRHHRRCTNTRHRHHPVLEEAIQHRHHDETA